MLKIQKIVFTLLFLVVGFISSFGAKTVTWKVDDSCRKYELKFTYQVSGATSTDTIASVLWKFEGRGTNITSSNDTATGIQFLDASKTKDSNFASIFIRYKNGDSAYFRRKIEIKHAPEPKFFAKNTCYDSATTFTNNTDTFGDPVTYYWKIVSIGINPYNKYYFTKNAPPTKIPEGNYAAYLKITDKNTGCSNYDSSRAYSSFTVQDVPLANFAGDTVVCLKKRNPFKSVSSTSYGNQPDSFVWDFGDGSALYRSPTRGVDTVSHIFTKSGNYKMKLLAFTDQGCVGVRIKTIAVQETPVADYSFVGKCQFSPIRFTNNSTLAGGGTLTYFWTIGTIDTTSAIDPKYTFNTSGNYKVTLQATSNAGCKDTFSKFVDVSKVSPIKYDLTEACAKDTNKFKDITFQNPLDTTVKRLWDFGDGTQDATNSKLVLHKYASSGTYNAYLELTTQKGCVSQQKFVVGAFDLPKPAFTASSSCANNKIVFTNTSTVSKGDSIANVIWNFGDVNATAKNPNITNTFSPTHIYTQSGTYTVKLTIVSKKACDSILTKTITVLAGPTLTYTNSTGCQNSDINFSFTGTSNTVRWDFGDTTTKADTSQSSIVKYKYSYGGVVNVMLTGKASNGCRDTLNKFITIFKKSVPDFITSGFCQEATTTFTSVSDTADPSPPLIGKYEWDLGGTLQSGASLDKTTINFSTPGTKTIKLTNTTKDGCSSSVIKNIVINAKPTADYIFSTNTCREDGVQFTNSSSNNVSFWDYNFNDGSAADSIPSPSHIFPINRDSEEVTLIVSTNKGCSDTVTKYPKYNKSPKAIPDLRPGDEAFCLGTPLQIDDLSENADGTNTTSRTWLFGDGTNSTDKQPNHVYTTFGDYDLKLVAYSSAGCKDTSKIVKITVFKPPFAVINYDKRLCANYPVTFFADSSVDAERDAYEWYIDGSTTAVRGIRVSYTFSAPGTYWVKLKAFNNVPDDNCSDMDSLQIEIKPTPVPDFSATAVCEGVLTKFTNLTTIVPPATTSQLVYNWSFGDDVGGTSDSVNPEYLYLAAGSYTVKLNATIDYGTFKCKALNPDTLMVTVNQNPKSYYSISPDPIDNLYPDGTFNDSSSADVTNWTLLWGDGDTTNSPTTIAHRYPTYPIDTNTFISKLYVSNASGCKDSSIFIVKLKQFLRPEIPNAFSPNGDGLNDYWKPYAKGVKSYLLSIMDRWGEIIYTTDDYDTNLGWDGTYRKTGDRVPDGIYFYSIEATDFDNLEVKKYKGSITIVR